MSLVSVAPFPLDSLIASSLSSHDFRDAYSIAISPEAPGDALVWTRAMFSSAPTLFTALLRMRDRTVAPLGLKQVSKERHDGLPFPMLGQTSTEVMLGLDDRHLDFRVSVLVCQTTVTVATAVEFHGVAGQIYFLPVRLAHPLIVRSMLRRVATRSLLLNP